MSVPSKLSQLQRTILLRLNEPQIYADLVRSLAVEKTVFSQSIAGLISRGLVEKWKLGSGQLCLGLSGAGELVVSEILSSLKNGGNGVNPTATTEPLDGDSAEPETPPYSVKESREREEAHNPIGFALSEVEKALASPVYCQHGCDVIEPAGTIIRRKGYNDLPWTSDCPDCMDFARESKSVWRYLLNHGFKLSPQAGLSLDGKNLISATNLDDLAAPKTGKFKPGGASPTLSERNPYDRNSFGGNAFGKYPSAAPPVVPKFITITPAVDAAESKPKPETKPKEFKFVDDNSCAATYRHKKMFWGYPKTLKSRICEYCKKEVFRP
ncbi:MAG: hypothetical protein WA197_23085 [Candidatus Acidiferrales bacterium]